MAKAPIRPETQRFTRAAQLAVATVFIAATLAGLRLASAGRVHPAAPDGQAIVGLASASSPHIAPADDPRADVLAALGKTIFFDASMSEPPGTSCASCHEPARAFSGANGSRLGVAQGSRPGHFAHRSTPSVLYLRYVPKFHLHWEEDAPLVDALGGFFWDGRVDSLSELSRQPLLEPDEMNNGSPEVVARKLAAAPYAAELRRAFGPTALDAADSALRALGDAISAFLTSPEMAPFSSRYDDFIRGRGTLTEMEREGLRLFKDSARGGCAACHKLSDVSPLPERSLFTDFAFDALAVPRNAKLPANRDPAHFDLGLCQRPQPRYRSDDEQFCGAFRTPSLRNVAVRPALMHNGVFTDLRQAVAFYATRATNPERWYGRAATYDDMPARYREYVGTDKAPYNRQPGERPALDDAEIDALVAFLRALTDAPFR
jgi:cytochrome c peroxidase